MNAWQTLQEKIPAIEKRLGYHFQNRHLLALAFVHRSFVNENREVVDQHNERLEFLGDSVLGLLVADYLYRYLPSTPEGELSHLRSLLVEASSCCTYVQKLDLEGHLLLGKGERRNQGRGRESILADLFEALIGAIYLDGGLEAASPFLFKNFSQEFGKILSQPSRNWKAELQDLSQKNFQETPRYEVLGETGPDHQKEFHVGVMIRDTLAGEGRGASKKEAQQAAASNALKRLQPPL